MRRSWTGGIRTGGETDLQFEPVARTEVLTAKKPRSSASVRFPAEATAVRIALLRVLHRAVVDARVRDRSPSVDIRFAVHVGLHDLENHGNQGRHYPAAVVHLRLAPPTGEGRTSVKDLVPERIEPVKDDPDYAQSSARARTRWPVAVGRSLESAKRRSNQP